MANSVKHADGPSVEALKERRPELFTHLRFRHEKPDSVMLTVHRVYHPLSGEDLCVSEEDLGSFFGAVEEFWKRIINDFYAATQR